MVTRLVIVLRELNYQYKNIECPFIKGKKQWTWACLIFLFYEIHGLHPHIRRGFNQSIILNTLSYEKRRHWVTGNTSFLFMPCGLLLLNLWIFLPREILAKILSRDRRAWSRRLSPLIPSLADKSVPANHVSRCHSTWNPLEVGGMPFYKVVISNLSSFILEQVLCISTMFFSVRRIQPFDHYVKPKQPVRQWGEVSFKPTFSSILEMWEGHVRRSIETRLVMLAMSTTPMLTPSLRETFLWSQFWTSPPLCCDQILPNGRHRRFQANSLVAIMSHWMRR